MEMEDLIGTDHNHMINHDEIIAAVLRRNGIIPTTRNNLPPDVVDYLDHGEIITAEFYPISRSLHCNKVYLDGAYQPKEIYSCPGGRKWLIDPRIRYDCGNWFLTTTVLVIHGNGQITSFPYWKTLLDRYDHIKTLDASGIARSIQEMIGCVTR